MIAYLTRYKWLKACLLILLMFVINMNVHGQMYILNEDFSTVATVLSPDGWSNTMINNGIPYNSRELADQGSITLK